MRVWKVAGNVVFSEDLTAQPIVPLPDKHAITVDADEGTYIFSVPTPELAEFLVEAANAWEQRARVDGGLATMAQEVGAEGQPPTIVMSRENIRRAVERFKATGVDA